VKKLVLRTFKTKENKELNMNHLNSTNNLGMPLLLRAQTSLHWYTQVEHITHFSPFLFSENACCCMDIAHYRRRYPL